MAHEEKKPTSLLGKIGHGIDVVASTIEGGLGVGLDATGKAAGKAEDVVASVGKAACRSGGETVDKYAEHLSHGGVVGAAGQALGLKSDAPKEEHKK
ncbi:hypothetical protein HYH03_014148 [Edaphochlamys debaryana]|uniref:Uncharacterized protein n=1 Tax=Edaphochlamys debaryana TaxID=47281 RepID=A0A836BS67_9CHLO|nr:hypothetical protein HYH03_014148 [Edaphochlamys debaryana]|eukprot:KAG2487166.1 hypothetical protein HYH03_014148 [Edaphochlamys debaryana]